MTREFDKEFQSFLKKFYSNYLFSRFFKADCRRLCSSSRNTACVLSRNVAIASPLYNKMSHCLLNDIQLSRSPLFRGDDRQFLRFDLLILINQLSRLIYESSSLSTVATSNNYLSSTPSAFSILCILLQCSLQHENDIQRSTEWMIFFNSTCL